MLQYWWQSPSILLGYAVYALAKSKVLSQPPLDLASIARQACVGNSIYRAFEQNTADSYAYCSSVLSIQDHTVTEYTVPTSTVYELRDLQSV